MSGDIPREEVERVLEELRAAKNDAIANQRFVEAELLVRAYGPLEALLKPKQYKVEWWVCVNQKGQPVVTLHPPPEHWGLLATKHYTDTLEHGEGME